MINKKKLVATKSGIKLTKPKRESFIPEDEQWLKENQISPGEYIGKGFFGVVYNVKGNSNLVVKVPVKVFKGGCDTKYKCWAKEEMESEAMKCNELHDSFGIPTKLVQVGKCVQGKDGYCLGLVRPKINEVNLKYRSDGTVIRPRISEELLEQLRQKLIRISEQGYVLTDGLQVGVTKTGSKIYQFDLGCLEKISSVEKAFDWNNTNWYNFLQNIGKRRSQYKPVDRSYK